jgi:hypothetical protein
MDRKTLTALLLLSVGFSLLAVRSFHLYASSYSLLASVFWRSGRFTCTQVRSLLPK